MPGYRYLDGFVQPRAFPPDHPPKGGGPALETDGLGNEAALGRASTGS
jgi:hypothetical protein